jgi:hypothetical protein
MKRLHYQLPVAANRGMQGIKGGQPAGAGEAAAVRSTRPASLAPVFFEYPWAKEVDSEFDSRP